MTQSPDGRIYNVQKSSRLFDQEWIEQKILLRFVIDGDSIAVVVSRMTPEGHGAEEISLR